MTDSDEQKPKADPPAETAADETAADDVAADDAAADDAAEPDPSAAAPPVTEAVNDGSDAGGPDAGPPDAAQTTFLGQPAPPPPPAAQQPDDQNAWAGRRLGAFVLQQEIGRGGMGVVYRARHEALERTVALKILPLASQLNSDQLRRFQNESRAAAQLNHTHIVPLFDVGYVEDTHFYSMQYIDGENLHQLIRSTRQQVSHSQRRGDAETPPGGMADTVDLQLRRDRPESGAGSGTAEQDGISLSADDFISAARLKRLPSGHRLPFNIARIGICVARALQCAHEQGIVHRDIKPSNLILDESGKVWVTDFGLAMVRSSPAITQAGVILGTLRYMSPEQASGRRAFVDHRTDVFSLGITLYELVTLRNAFRGEDESTLLRRVTLEKPTPIRKVCPSIPEDLATIIEKAYERNPDDRYQTAAALAGDLQRFLEGRPILARPPSLSRRIRQWCVEHERLATAGFMFIVCSLLLSAATAGVIWVAYGEARQARELAEERLAESEARRLSTRALLELENNPGRAQAMAGMGAANSSGTEAQSVLLQAFDNNHELLLTRSQLPWVQMLEMSPDGSRFVEVSSPDVEDRRATIAVRNTADGRLLQVLGTRALSPTVAYDGQGRFLVVCSHDDGTDTDEAPFSSTVQLWTATDLEPVNSFATSLRDARLLGMDAAAERLVLPNVSGRLQIVSAVDGRLELELEDVGAVFTEAEFSPDGRLVLGVTADGDVAVFDAQTGQSAGTIPSRIPPAFRGRVPLPAGRRARFSFDSQLVVIMSGGVFVHPITTDDNGPRVSADSMAARGESRILLSRQRNVGLAFAPSAAALKLIDLRTGATLVDINTGTRPMSVGLLPGGETCYATELKRIRLFSTISGQQIASLDGHTQQISAVATCESAGTLVSADQGGNLLVWAIRSGRERRSIPTHQVIGNHPQLIDTNAAGALSLSGPVMAYRTLLLDGNQPDAEGKEFAGRMCRGGLGGPGRVITLQDDAVVLRDPATRRLLSRVVAGGSRVVRARALADDVIVFNTEDDRLYWYHQGEDQLRLLGRVQMSAHDIPVSADGVRFAYRNDRGLAIICETRSGQQLSRMASPYAVLDMDFHPRDGSLFLGCKGGRVESQTVAGRPGDFALQSDERISEFDQLRFTGDGTALLTWSSAGGNIYAWDAQTGELIDQRPCPRVSDIRPHSTRPLVVMFSSFGGAWLWDLQTKQFSELSERRILDAVITTDQLFVLSEAGPTQPPAAGQPPAARVPLSAEVFARELDSDTVLFRRELPLRAEQLDISDDGSMVAVTTARYGVSVVDDRFPGRPTFVGSHHQPPVAAAFHETDEVTTISPDGHLETRRSTGELIRTRSHTPDLLAVAAITSTGQWAATGGTEGGLLLWSLDDEQDPVAIDRHKAAITHVAFSRNGSVLAVSDDDEWLRFYAVPDGKVLAEYNISCLDVCVSPDGRQAVVITGGLTSEVTQFGGVKTRLQADSLLLLDLTRQQSRVLEEQSVGLSCQYSERGSEFLVLQNEGSVQLYAANGTPQVAVRSIDQRFFAAAFLQAGERLVTASSTGLAMWDSASGSRIYEVPWSDQSLGQTGARWSPENPARNEFLIHQEDRLVRWPLDVMDFTTSTTRPLTDQERATIQLRSESPEP